MPRAIMNFDENELLLHQICRD